MVRVTSRSAQPIDAGRAGSLSVDDAVWLMRSDAGRLRRLHRGRDHHPRTSSAAVARRVAAVRRGLGPINDPYLLASSLLREAGLAHALGSDLGPLRIGYAIRYAELTTGIARGRGPAVTVPDPMLPAPERPAGCAEPLV